MATELLASGGLVPAVFLRCADRCAVEECAAARLRRGAPLAEVHCICHGTREWVALPSERSA